MNNSTDNTVMDQSDSGGVAALKGFTYQNFVAAYSVLKMLRDKSLVSVRCEVVDDIDLVYEDKIEFIQVKTTDGDSKWCVQEFSEATTKSVPPTGRQKVNQIVSLEDSILHKSILCDKEKLPGFFRIWTSRDVTNSLRYLKIPIRDRVEKIKEREPLLKRLSASVNRNRKNLPPFCSKNGNGIEYWLDHAEWTVISTQEHIELLCTKLILQSAQQRGIYLSSNEDPERILASLLKNVTGKGAASRILNTIANKSYHRDDFIQWFYAEVEYYAMHSSSHIKVYSTSHKHLTAILSTFFRDKEMYKLQGEKSCTGLHGQYHQRKYSYNIIAKSLQKWLPEVLLLPAEIADNSPENLTNKFSIFTNRYNKNTKFMTDLVSRALLHSTVRTQYRSQPIAAELHMDDSESTCFDNIHIILEDHSLDKLIMGFSEFIGNNIEISLAKIASRFNSLIESEAFSNKKEKILTFKDDRYLLKHDIDEILVANKSLDESLDRIKFVFFIGYESAHLKCNNQEMEVDYLESLKSEVSSKFETLIDEIIEKNAFCEDLHIEVYLYPVPSIKSLIKAFQSQGESQWNLV